MFKLSQTIVIITLNDMEWNVTNQNNCYLVYVSECFEHWCSCRLKLKINFHFLSESKTKHK